MLAKIAPRFVISGVIQNAYYANYMAIDLTKQIIGDCTVDYFEHDPKHYYVHHSRCRNATSSDTSPPSPDPLSSPASTKPKSTTRLSKNSQSTTKSGTSSINSTSSPSRLRNFTELLKPTIPALTSSPADSKVTR